MRKAADIVLVIHNVRSAYNVGAMLRTADGLALKKVYISGYSPYPKMPDDSRLPHVADRANRLIHKTALGAENSVAWAHVQSIAALIDKLHAGGYTVLALEQSVKSQMLAEYKAGDRIALIVGSEVNGLEPKVLELADESLEIPMLGTKESYNVAVATGMALYHLRFLA